MRKRKFVRVDIDCIFDRVRLYGWFVEKDEFGNYRVKVKYRFSIYKHWTKREGLPWILGSFFMKSEVIWHPGPDSWWRFALGDIINLPQGTHIEEADEAEAKRKLKKAMEANKTGFITTIIGTKEIPKR